MSRNEPPLTAYFVSSLRLGRILVRKPQFEMKYCSGADGEVYWKKKTKSYGKHKEDDNTYQI